MFGPSRFLSAALVMLLVVAGSHANIHLTVSNDVRRDIDLGTFAFSDHGEFRLKVSKFFLDDAASFIPPSLGSTTVQHNEQIGFVLDPVLSAHYARVENAHAKTAAAERKCFVDDPLLRPDDLSRRRIFSLNGLNITELAATRSFSASISKPGLYALFFFNCKGFNSSEPLKPIKVSFTADTEMYNVDLHGNKNYNGVGKESLPLIYGFFTIIFIALGVLIFREMKANAIYVQRVHYVMLFLVSVKALSLLFEAAKFSHYGSTGKASAWDVFYYIFLTMKGVSLFGVILLLGSGWSIMKAFLSEQDKKLLMILLPCQVIVNIAIAVIEETSEGSKSWSTWSDLLKLLDVFCCCAVLLPIVWSMKNLRDASGQDDKAAQTLSRMRLFRTFYIVIVAYIYFTRIIMVMVDGTISYNKIWFAKIIRELAAVAFYAYVGYRFRPMKENPYLNLEQEDLDELEMRNEVDNGGDRNA